MLKNKYCLLIDSPKTGKYFLDVEGPNIGTAVETAFLTGKFKDKEDKYFVDSIRVIDEMKRRGSLEFILNHYGPDSQRNVAIEEMSELTKELCKVNRGKEDIKHICEEIADAKIMLNQLTLNYDEELIDKYYNEKINRQISRIEEGK